MDSPKPRVLLVEGDDRWRKRFTEALEIDFSVTGTNNLRDGMRLYVSMAKEHQLDLLVCAGTFVANRDGFVWIQMVYAAQIHPVIFVTGDPSLFILPAGLPSFGKTKGELSQFVELAKRCLKHK